MPKLGLRRFNSQTIIRGCCCSQVAQLALQLCCLHQPVCPANPALSLFAISAASPHPCIASTWAVFLRQFKKKTQHFCFTETIHVQFVQGKTGRQQEERKGSSWCGHRGTAPWVWHTYVLQEKSTTCSSHVSYTTAPNSLLSHSSSSTPCFQSLVQYCGIYPVAPSGWGWHRRMLLVLSAALKCRDCRGICRISLVMKRNRERE